MPSRTEILDRICKALDEPAVHPPYPLQKILFTPIEPNNLLLHFERELTAVKGDFFSAHNWQEAQSQVESIAKQHSLQHICISPHPEVVKVCGALPATILSGEKDCGKALANADLGITACECLIARTGSVMLTTKTGFGRVLSVLPPIHLVVAQRNQLVSDLDDAYQLLYNRYRGLWPSMITLITGPSRTADIEKAIVLGAHGPKKLFVLLLNF